MFSSRTTFLLGAFIITVCNFQKQDPSTWIQTSSIVAEWPRLIKLCFSRAPSQRCIPQTCFPLPSPFNENSLLADPPKIISPLKRNVYLKTGDTLKLKCEATGFPYPQFTWTRQGRRIRNQSLVLNRVSRNDSGLYLCKAFNTDGEDSMEVIVTIEDREKSTQATGK